MTHDDYKQLLDILCDEVNVENLCLGSGLSESGERKEILYNRETRKIILGATVSSPYGTR